MKKIISIVLLCVFFTTIMSGVIGAEGSTISGKVSYSSIGLPEDQVKYYYSDKYFNKASTEYNGSLATMSMCLAMSAYGSVDAEDYAEYAKNVTTLLNEIGFKDIEVNDDFKIKPSEDSLGAVAAYKVINDYVVIVAVPRSGRYETEWASNFTIGENGRHTGFDQAAKKLMNFLEEYIEKNQAVFAGKTVKLWTAGFSRGAAVANLFAADLTQIAREQKKIAQIITIEQENIYAYCFEGPKGGNRDCLEAGEDPEKSYLNIHNVVNENDLVGKVAMKSWGFFRYGVDHHEVVPNVSTTEYRENSQDMLAMYVALDTNLTRLTTLYKNGEPYHVLESFQGVKLNQKFFNTLKKNELLYTFAEEKLNKGIDESLLIQITDQTMPEYLDEMVRVMAESFVSREYYVENFQTTFRLVGSAVFGKGNEKEKWQKVWNQWTSDISENVFELAKASEKSTDTLAQKLQAYLVESMQDAGINIDAYEGLDEAIPLLMQTVARMVKQGGFDLLLTTVKNAPILVMGHIPELCFAWLQSKDRNYEKDLEAAKAANTKPTVFIKEFTVTLAQLLGWDQLADYLKR